MPLDLFEELKDTSGAISLVCPTHSTQATSLRSAKIHFETNTPNPTWRLQLRIGLKGLDHENPEAIIECHPTLNLHTSDATAAQTRGSEAVQSLIAHFEEMGKKYPAMVWRQNGDDNSMLALQDPEGTATPHDPDPQILSDFFEDMPNPKQNFRVVIKPQVREQNNAILHLE